ncbi:MAG: preprotein translocase subunit SecE [Deltaproteobacteria bacterium]|jgi:preprotein translocase subunit SecE
MGRLLKKKEPSLKKKNKSDEKKSAESETETARLNFTNQTTAGTVKENQQKIALVKKAIAGGAMYKINNKYVDQALQFLREVKVELKKVAWPSRKQAMGSTIVVVMLVLLVSFFLGIVDIGLSSLIKAVLS